jgi:hypothetical protein
MHLSTLVHVVLSPTAQRLGVASLSWALVRSIAWPVCLSAFTHAFVLFVVLLGLSAGVLKHKATRLERQLGALDTFPW